MKNISPDKILLLILILIMTAVVIFFAVKGMDKGFTWATHVYDNFQGALLGLITGYAIAKGSSKNDPPAPLVEVQP